MDTNDHAIDMGCFDVEADTVKDLEEGSNPQLTAGRKKIDIAQYTTSTNNNFFAQLRYI
jgi:hypothetical protein